MYPQRTLNNVSSNILISPTCNCQNSFFIETGLSYFHKTTIRFKQKWTEYMIHFKDHRNYLSAGFHTLVLDYTIILHKSYTEV